MVATTPHHCRFSSGIVVSFSGKQIYQLLSKLHLPVVQGESPHWTNHISISTFLCRWRAGILTSQSKGLFANSGINLIQFTLPHVEGILDLYSNGGQSPSRLVREAKSWEWHHCPRACLCFSACWLLQTGSVVAWLLVRKQLMKSE